MTCFWRLHCEAGCRIRLSVYIFMFRCLACAVSCMRKNSFPHINWMSELGKRWANYKSSSSRGRFSSFPGPTFGSRIVGSRLALNAKAVIKCHSKLQSPNKDEWWNDGDRLKITPLATARNARLIIRPICFFFFFVDLFPTVTSCTDVLSGAWSDEWRSDRQTDGRRDGNVCTWASAHNSTTMLRRLGCKRSR